MSQKVLTYHVTVDDGDTGFNVYKGKETNILIANTSDHSFYVNSEHGDEELKPYKSKLFNMHTLNIKAIFGGRLQPHV